MFTKEQIEEFEEVVKPVSEWIRKNTHPHVEVVIDCNSAKLSEMSFCVDTEEPIEVEKV